MIQIFFIMHIQKEVIMAFKRQSTVLKEKYNNHVKVTTEYF